MVSSPKCLMLIKHIHAVHKRQSTKTQLISKRYKWTQGKQRKLNKKQVNIVGNHRNKREHKQKPRRPKVNRAEKQELKERKQNIKRKDNKTEHNLNKRLFIVQKAINQGQENATKQRYLQSSTESYSSFHSQMIPAQIKNFYTVIICCMDRHLIIVLSFHFVVTFNSLATLVSYLPIICPRCSPPLPQN